MEEAKAAAGGEKRVTRKITVSASVGRMLDIAAAEMAARDGGRPCVSDVVAALIGHHWRDLGGPPPPLAPEPPPSGIFRESRGDA